MTSLLNFDSAFSLKDKNAIVTGGSRGIGLHIATAFLLSGCSRVVITGRKLDGKQGITQAVDRLNRMPNIRGKAVGIAGDAGNSKDIARMSQEVESLLGDKGLHILVCNAGTGWGSRFEDAPSSSSTKILDLNVRGVFELVQRFHTQLARASGDKDPSRVLIVSSTAGENITALGENGTIMYSASKAAANHLGRNLAVELGPKNITTNIISPGFFPTKLAGGLIENLGGQQAMSSLNPLGRLGEPEDIAGVAVFLCSPAGRYVNGVNIAVDGAASISPGRVTKL